MQNKPKQLSLLIVLLSIYLFSCSSLNEDPGQVIIRGKAIDAISGEPFDSLLITMINEHCFFSDLGYCEPVNASKYTDSQGNFYMTFLQNCPTEMQARIPKKYSKNYGQMHVEFYSTQGRDFYWGCNDRPVFDLTESYTIEVQVHPTIQLNIERQDFDGLEFKSLKIPEFGIEITNFDYYLQSHVLKLSDYKGVVEVVLEYKDGQSVTYTVEYDYFQQQIYDLLVNV